MFISEEVIGKFYAKIGFNGALGQNVYKQKYQDGDSAEVYDNEKSLFQTAFVPLSLEIEGEIVWNDRKANRFHFWRPLKLQYKKETKELSQVKFGIICS